MNASKDGAMASGAGPGGLDRRIKVLAIVGVAALVLGLVAWALQLSGGLLGGSSMTNIFLWGLMIALFAFMVGFGAGSQFVACAIYLFGRDELLPIARVAAACALACVGAAGIAILADLGAVRNIFDMVFGANLASPLSWDMIAFVVFILLAIVELVFMARRSAATKALVVACGVVALGLQIVEGLLFSLQTSHAWWATPVMPIDFVAVAFVSGTSLMLLVALAKGTSAAGLAWMARFCAWAIAAHLVLALTDLCLVAFEGSAVSGGVLSAIWSVLPLYLLELTLPAVAMVLLFLFAKRSKEGGAADARFVLAGGILAIVGVFFHRLMLLYPAYNAPSLYLTLSGTDLVTGPYPISTGRYLDWGTTFSLVSPYAPSGLEWMAALLPLGIGIVGTLVLLWIMAKIGRPAPVRDAS